ncbi:MAG: hypothetical protein QM503_03165 [Bacteroidota bacterium]
MKNTRLIGGTLIESVTAMTLVLLITALVFSFFVKINTTSVLGLELEAFLTAKLIINNTKKNQSYHDDEWESSKFSIKKKVIVLNEQSRVYYVIVEIKDHKKRNVIIYKTIIVDHLYQ